MNPLQIFLIVVALAAGIYGTVAVKKLIGADRPSPAQARYLACIEQGRDSQQCAIDELMLRGLTCRS